MNKNFFFQMILVSFVVCLAGCGKEESTSPSSAKGEASPKPKAKAKAKESAKRKPISGAIQAESLAKEFIDDLKAAEKKHQFKPVIVEGVVVKVAAEMAPLTLTLKGSKDQEGNEITIVCAFPVTARSNLEKVKVGEIVGVEGKCFGMLDSDSVAINICSLVK